MQEVKLNKKYETLIEDDVEIKYLLDDILALKKTKKECEIRIVFNKGKLNKKRYIVRSLHHQTIKQARLQIYEPLDKQI